MKKPKLTRRDFLHSSSLIGSSSLLGLHSIPVPVDKGKRSKVFSLKKLVCEPERKELINFRPAKWIWFPSKRTLQNTFFLFRKTFFLRELPKTAKGWILADSRYQLFVNGQRLQWGPVPADPRWPEADPLEIVPFLKKGENVIGVQVLFYGQGDGTWPIGKPGLIFKAELEFPGRPLRQIVSNHSWKVNLCRAWQPGHYKRWYLRSLQEEFDARLYPYGWANPGFTPEGAWLEAMELDCRSDKPALCSTYPEYMTEMRGDPDSSYIVKRSIPALSEEKINPAHLAEAYQIKWSQPPRDYFEFVTPGAFGALPFSGFNQLKNNTLQFDLDGEHGIALTFELAEQMVGWPGFTVEAPEGTTIELMTHEAHQVGTAFLLNTHFNSWSRWICKEGPNHFEAFDFESCRWIQLHFHGTRGRVTLHSVGIRRRVFPWPREPLIYTSEKALQRLWNASVNTLNNSAQDILVDGMGRERQQYSGDCGHQIHAIYFTFGEYRQPARYLKTFSQGMTLDGFFLDCWPAYDRLARLMERQLHLTKWGPLLDHGVGFIFDNYYHYLYSGRLADLRETYPRLLRFAEYLKSIQKADGLLPVENIGIPAVWIDHVAYRQQRHKQCAFNLYAAAMLQNALPALCKAFGDAKNELEVKKFGQEILDAAVRRFWSKKHQIFINNLPWLAEESEIRMCDRSLATAILFDQCPANKTAHALRTLIQCPPEMGFSYPANAGWRLWALGKMGRTDVILRDFRERWAKMDSVILNNTLQENWTVSPDSGSQWSHCPVAPLYVLYMSVLGIKPLEPGFLRYEIKPRLADLKVLRTKANTPLGPIFFEANGPLGKRKIEIETPHSGKGELVVSSKEKVDLEPVPAGGNKTLARYRLPEGRRVKIELKYS